VPILFPQFVTNILEKYCPLATLVRPPIFVISYHIEEPIPCLRWIRSRKGDLPMSSELGLDRRASGSLPVDQASDGNIHRPDIGVLQSAMLLMRKSSFKPVL